ncbi:MAG TPA: prepilin-type N-terminal cleavage/methylation domain-containing protein [Thermoanaerobaculia bacterium]|jgi:type II secretory pathway pseudopilin PulG|nr:prepilin-type N-terminal cleavage/methylation domain-containing protein [Thermoanaerobaculia bacterium]
MELTGSGRRPAHAPAAAGFSLIEALIAAAILLIIALGLIPLFSRAINDNVNGNDATQATNGSRTQLEEMLGLPFVNTRLTVPVGANVGVTTDSFAQGDIKKTGDPDEGWWPGTPTDKGVILWTRTTQVRQYSVSDLNTPLPGETQPTFVQLKEVTVVMSNGKLGSILGSGQGITLRIVKPF